jgi:hypothetical protein
MRETFKFCSLTSSQLPGDEVRSYAGHAHPYPKNRKATKTQQLSKVFAGIDVQLMLTGLPGENRRKVTDVYCPEIRRSPPTDYQHINHLDVVSCWKGLSFRQAREVAHWEYLFKHVLEHKLRDTVLRVTAERAYRSHAGKRMVRYCRELDTTDTVTDQMALLDGTFNNASVAADMIGSIFSENTTRTIAVNALELIDDMIHMFYEDQSNVEYTWFKSSGNLPAAIYNFLRTRDCFLDTFPFPSLEVSFSYKQCNSGLSIFGEVRWQPPNISFPNLPVRLHTGAEYRIAPQYLEPNLGCKYSPGFARFDVVPEYSVTSLTIPVAWDSNLCCFRSIVPPNKQRHQVVEHMNASTKSMKTAETQFSAKIVMEFPTTVRFEQTTRYSIRLEIEQSIKAPREVLRSSIPAYNVEPEDAKSPSVETVNLYLSPRSQKSPIVGSDCRLATSHARVSSWLPSYTITPLSKRGCPDSVHEHMSEGSVDDGRGSSIATSSIERSLERLVHNIGMATQSRKYSPWSCDNYTDEVASQVDALVQNRDPGQIVDGKEEVFRKDVEYVADYDNNKNNDSHELLLSSLALSKTSQNHTQSNVSPTAATDTMDMIAGSADRNDLGNKRMGKFARDQGHNYFVKAFPQGADKTKASIETPSTATLEATSQAAIQAACAASKPSILASAAGAVDTIAEMTNYEKEYDERLTKTHENASDMRPHVSPNECTFKVPRWRKFVENLEEDTKPEKLYSMMLGQPLSQVVKEPLDANTSRVPSFHTDDAVKQTERVLQRALTSRNWTVEGLTNRYTTSGYRSSRDNSDVGVDSKAAAVDMGLRRIEMAERHEKRLELDNISIYMSSSPADEDLTPYNESYRSIQEPSDTLENEKAHHILPQKRKATTHMDVFFRTPSSFRTGHLALDQFEHLDLELAAKRQRLSDRVDSGCDMRDTCHGDCGGDWDDQLVSLGNVTTGQLGEAIRISSPFVGSHGWFEKLSAEVQGEGSESSDGVSYATRSRAYETNAKISKVVPALRKKGSVKRMVFLRRAKTGLITELPTLPITEESKGSRSPSKEALRVDSVLPDKVCVKNSKAAMEWSSPSPKGAWNEFHERHNRQLDEFKKQYEVVCIPDQQEIQQTYQQLLKEKSGKEKAISTEIPSTFDTSPASKYIKEETKRVDEEELKAFEKIFLEDNSERSKSESEMEWSTQEEDLSQELSVLALGGSEG